MSKYYITSIGTTSIQEGRMFIHVDKQYIPALQGLDGFSHLKIMYWLDDFDTKEARSVLDTPRPYRNAPETIGIFATRSPVRPNPIALSSVSVIDIDYVNGVIEVGYIDANDGSPVIDIKPYTPSIDRVQNFSAPAWCSHWPDSLETSAEFDWENEFNFYN